MNSLRRALAAILVLTVAFGVLYPLAVTAVARVVFAHRAGGSPVMRDGVVVGSEFVAQAFTDERWFWPRPSATAPPWNAASSSGSNLGPLHPGLQDAVRERVARLALGAPAPIDLVTTSGSGLDPHVTPAGALAQVSRVARARGIDPVRLQELVFHHVEPRTLGWLGEPRVNVLLLNLALEDH